MEKSIETTLGTWTYSDIGEGEPLILLHGIFMNRHLWDQATQTLQKTYRVICIDGPSHGNSESVARSWSLSDHALALEGFIGTLGLKKGHIAGHSWGGLVAMRLALRNPSMIQTLILCNTPLEESQSKLMFQVQGLFLIGKAGRRFFARQAAKALFDRDPKVTFSLEASLENQDGRGLRQAIRAVLVEAKDFYSELKNLKMPVCYITGAKDYVCSDRIRKELEDLGAEPFIVAGGHTSPLEQPQEVSEIIVRHIIQN